jgi:glycosyltransferase involved in cell wall biosynthesis
MGMNARGGTALIWSYSTEEPSFRHRMLNLIPELSRRGWDCRVDILPHGRYVRRIIERRHRLRTADLLILQKIKPSPLEYRLLRRLASSIVYDVDDAIYFRRPRLLGDPPDRGWFRRYKFGRTCALADLVIVCNRTIRSHAERAARRLEISPTPVDLASYEEIARSERREAQTLVWIGLPENLVYLELVRPVLSRLAAQYPELRLRVVSSRFPDWPDVPVEPVHWSEAAEIASLVTAGIGIMPLTDDEWTRGKCAFKLLQCMAAGLPCVASPVGANLEAIEHGVSGFLSADPDDWERALRTLLDDPGRAVDMGRAGLRVIRDRFDVPVVIPRVADLIEDVVHRAADD